MNKIAVIGGSRLISLKNFAITHSTTMQTPYGAPSAPLNYGVVGEKEVVFLPRRGSELPMPPHKINYQANIWALRDAGVQTIIATAAVAGIGSTYQPGDLVLPDQLIDYTYGRENTFFGEDSPSAPVDFAEPYSEQLRQKVIHNANRLNIQVYHPATYGITQGPRYETLAEVKRLDRDGCHIVGMTGMPEAALARELGLHYVLIGIVVRIAGRMQKTTESEARVAEYEIELARLLEGMIQDLDV